MREDLSLRRKQEDETFLVKFPLGLRGGHVVLPKGLIQGQKLTEILRRLTLPVARINRFDELPTRFRTVATDLENGAAVVMDSGDLTSAMRASISAPGVFEPFERDGRTLVDGGLVDNVPVDIARAMGVDILIVVDVGFPLLQLKQLSSAPLISNQMLAILIQRSSQAQLATLTPSDVLIQPPLGSISSFDFGAVSKAIATGEVAARARSAQLASLAVSPEQMQRYAQARAARRLPPPVVDFVRVSPDSQAYVPPAAQELFRDLEGKPLDADAAQAAVTALYGRGSLDMLDYRVIGSGDRYGLVLDARPTWHGPDYMRFGLSLQDDLQGGSTYNAAVRFVVSDITRNAGEWVTDLQIGSAAQISTELFLPLAQYSGWFVMPARGRAGARHRPGAGPGNSGPSTASIRSTTAWTSDASSATGARSVPGYHARKGTTTSRSVTPVIRTYPISPRIRSTPPTTSCASPTTGSTTSTSRTTGSGRSCSGPACATLQALRRFPTS